jgi:hypothetical protein
MRSMAGAAAIRGHLIGDVDTVIDWSPEHGKGPALDQESEFDAYLDQLRDWLSLRESGGSGSGGDHSIPPGWF